MAAVNGENKITVAMTGDTIMRPGVHATAYSLMKNLNKGWSCDIHFFGFGYEKGIQQSLEQTLSPFEERVHVKVTHMEEKKIKGARSFHGSFVPYVVFHIPHLVDAGRVIFLDCDLIVTCDLSALWESDLSGNAVGAVPVGVVQRAHPKCRKFMLDNGLNQADPHYNTGVLLIDTGQWKDENYTKRMIEVASIGAPGDQDVINVVADIVDIKRKYNTTCGPADTESELLETDPANLWAQDQVFHLYGSPKPWEPFARRFHPYYTYFKIVEDECRGFRRSKGEFRLRKVRRMFRLSRSYFKLFERGMKKIRQEIK